MYKSEQHKLCVCEDGNIDSLRAARPQGLHFVVGDTHGEYPTLLRLMEKLRFDPSKDHVWFVGDYNAGGDPTALLTYISAYCQPDPRLPGFHLIRGNHERELSPLYELENLPDIAVLRGGRLTFWLAHAGMIASVFELICRDLDAAPGKAVFCYRLEDDCVAYDAPLRQIVWSRRGLYSHRSRWNLWPSEETLLQRGACIIHGHTPYCYFTDYSSYGDRNLFWKKQRIWFSEDLQSFNIDSNVKGRWTGGELYRGLSCLCLEALEDAAFRSDRGLTVDGLLQSPNAVFSVPYIGGAFDAPAGDLSAVLNAAPEQKTIALNADKMPYMKRKEAE